MFTKFSKFVSALMITTLLATFGASSVWAQETITDETVPTIPTAGSLVRIEPGTWQWYTFRSQVPVDVEEDDDAVVTDPEEATIDIALKVQTGSVGFEVWSAEDLNNWRNGVDFDPTGIGTVNEFMTNDPLFWQGSFQTNDDYHLIVKNTGTEAAFYSLDITGDVRLPSSTSMQTEAAPAEAMADAPNDGRNSRNDQHRSQHGHPHRQCDNRARDLAVVHLPFASSSECRRG